MSGSRLESSEVLTLGGTESCEVSRLIKAHLSRLRRVCIIDVEKHRENVTGGSRMEEVIK